MPDPTPRVGATHDQGTAARRYEARQAADDSYDDENDWTVYDEHGFDISVRYWTEAEAKIIAFALNGVVAGKVLFLALPGSGVEIYPGPTEGVAPDA